MFGKVNLSQLTACILAQISSNFFSIIMNHPVYVKITPRTVGTEILISIKKSDKISNTTVFNLYNFLNVSLFFEAENSDWLTD